MQTCLNCGKIWDLTENPSECPACGWDVPGATPPPPPPPSPFVGADDDPFDIPTPSGESSAPPPSNEPFGGNPFASQADSTSSPAASAGPAMAYQPPPKKGMSTTAKVLIGVGLGVGLVIVIGVIAAVLLFRQATSIIEEDGGAGFFGGTDVSDLDVGACFDSSLPGVEVACSEPHTHEVFGLVPWTGSSSYPTALQVFSEVYCEDAFDAYVGIDYFESALFYETARPSEAAWNAGERDIRCVLYEPGTTLRGSEFGSAR